MRKKAEKKISEINKAYTVLSDDQKRKQYDMGGFDMGGFQTGGHNFNINLNDLFGGGGFGGFGDFGGQNNFRSQFQSQRGG